MTRTLTSKSAMIGFCANCKELYEAACAVPHPNSEIEMLCLYCGFGLFRKRMRRSLWFGFCGGLFGWSIASARWHAGLPLALIALLCSYASWSTFWGWHVGAKRWGLLYQTLKKALRITPLCLAMLLCMRIFAALLLGAIGNGIKQSLRMLQLLRRLKKRPSLFAPADSGGGANNDDLRVSAHE